MKQRFLLLVLGIALPFSHATRAEETGPADAPAPAAAPTAPADDAVSQAAQNSAPATPGLFSFRADNVPLKQALALFAHANRLNIISDLDVEGTVTVSFHDLPLDFAMRALLDANGCYFKNDNGLIRVKHTETRLFHVDYIHTTRTGQGSNAVQITSGGGSQSGGGGGGGKSGGSENEGSSMTVTNTSTINFWGELAEQVKSMLSPKGSLTLNSLSGTVMVHDSHEIVENIASYIHSVTNNVSKQVDIEVEIYEVSLNKNSQLGVDWQHVSDSLDTTFNTLPGQSGLSDAGGLTVGSAVFGKPPGAPGIIINHSRGSFKAVLTALKEQGDLKVVSKPRLRTLNNQPAVVRVGQDLPVFSTQVTISPGVTPIQTETESIQTITVGTVLSITPQISEDGLITLDITPAVSRLVRMDVSASKHSNAPVVDIRQASSIVRMRDGATIIMGGLVQDSKSSTQRKVPVLGDIPLLGRAFTSDYKLNERTELIFFLTPHIVTDETDQKNSVKSPAN